MILNNLIKSPINYTGNKYQILNQILPKMNTKNKKVIDLCSGGATVGINLIDAKEVTLIEKNQKVTSLLKYLGTENFDSLIKRNEKIINKYKLSNSNKYGTKYYQQYRDGNNGLKNYNKSGFEELRATYNNRKNKYTKIAIHELYILMVYGFNNEMRFNKFGNFNIPCGKTDFNKNNYIKLKEFNERYDSNKYVIKNIDIFSEEALEIYCEADVIYVDPPYLITLAGYNESDGWNIIEEEKLLGLILILAKQNKHIFLSNVLESDNKENKILMEWCKKNKDIITIHEIEKHYKSSSYNKKVRGKNREVLIEVKYEDK